MKKYIFLFLLILCRFCINLSGQTWSVDALPVARSYSTVATVGSKILMIAGNTGSSTVDIYDETTNTWATTPLSFPELKVKAATIGNKVYCLQGYSPVTSDFVKNLDIYNATTNTWQRDSMPFAPRDVGVGAIGSKLFIAGGLEITQTSINTLNLVRIFDTLTQRWTYSTPLSVARRDIEVVRVKNKLLFIGGFSENPRTAWEWTFYKNIDIYDETTGTWSTVFMKTGRLSPSITVSGSKVLIVGGGYKLGFVSASPVVFFTKTAEIYDVDTDTWQTADLPKPRLAQTIAAYDKKAYLICGSTQDETNATRATYNKVDVYNFTTNTWSELPFSDVTQARMGGLTANLKNKIYFMGGLTSSFAPTKRIDILTLPPSSIFEPMVLDNKLSVFPNPVKQELVVDFDKKEEKDYAIKVTNALGQIVFTQQNIDINPFKMDVTPLNQGVHFMTIYTSKGVKSQSFIKQ